jgi:hypothetical protein
MRTQELMFLFKDIELLSNLEGPAIWLDIEGCYTVDPIDFSLTNYAELNVAKDLVRQMGDIVGDDEIAFITPYSRQV